MAPVRAETTKSNPSFPSMFLRGSEGSKACLPSGQRWQTAFLMRSPLAVQTQVASAAVFAGKYVVLWMSICDAQKKQTALALPLTCPKQIEPREALYRSMRCRCQVGAVPTSRCCFLSRIKSLPDFGPFLLGPCRYKIAMWHRVRQEANVRRAFGVWEAVLTSFVELCLVIGVVSAA